MTERSIASLAILKVNWDEGRDYIENFVPFVAECLRTSPQPIVSLLYIQDAILNSFGLKIPQGALKIILHRTVKHGYVTKTEKMYRRNNDALVSLDFARKRDDVLRQCEALILKLIDFCKTQYQRNWSREDAWNTILSYLHERSAPILIAAIEGEPFPPPDRKVKNAEFLVNVFIKYLKDTDPNGFNFLVTIVKGSMLANTLFLPDISKIDARFEKVKVYLDTNFILRALGYSRQGTHTPCKELLDLMYVQNVELRCFQHTLNEIYGILEADVKTLLNRSYLKHGYEGSLEYFIRSNYSASDVELIITRLRTLMRNLRIQVKDTPEQSAKLILDEKKFESILQDFIGYKSREARINDLESLTAIYRLRRGQFPRRLESCYAIFITTNANLVKASNYFFREEFDEYGGVVPISLLDHVLTTLVWLKKPLNAPDLPRKKVIADCYAALNPSNTLWRRYLEEINKLRQQDNISEEDYYLLRFSTEAKSTLMEYTLGDPNAIIEGTIEEILEKALSSARAETEEKLRIEEEKRLKAERDLEEAKHRIIEAEGKSEAWREAQLQSFRNIGVKIGRLISITLLIIINLLLGISVILTVPIQYLPKLKIFLSKLPLPVILFLLFIWSMLSIFNISFSAPLHILFRKFEIFSANLIEKILIWITEPRKK